MQNSRLVLAVCSTLIVCFNQGCNTLHSNQYGQSVCSSCDSCPPAQTCGDVGCSGAADESSAAQQIFLEQASVQGNDELEVERVRRQIDESLQSRVSLDMGQRLRFGELQVDHEKLEKLIVSRKKQLVEEKRTYDEFIRLQEDYYRQEREKQLRVFVDSLESLAASSSNGGQLEPQVLPPPPKFQPPPPAPKLAIRAAEIPFVVPVTLEVSLGNSAMGRPRIRQIWKNQRFTEAGIVSPNLAGPSMNVIGETVIQSASIND